MSTTWPWNGPGARNSRSDRLPRAPPSTRPSEIAHGTDRNRRAVQPIQPITATVITGTPRCSLAHAEGGATVTQQRQIDQAAEDADRLALGQNARCTGI